MATRGQLYFCGVSHQSLTVRACGVVWLVWLHVKRLGRSMPNNPWTATPRTFLLMEEGFSELFFEFIVQHSKCRAASGTLSILRTCDPLWVTGDVLFP